MKRRAKIAYRNLGIMLPEMSAQERHTMAVKTLNPSVWRDGNRHACSGPIGESENRWMEASGSSISVKLRRRLVHSW